MPGEMGARAPGSVDDYWMDHALALARQGVAQASPNPTVGCVLVDAANHPVGEGFHNYNQRDHAEVVALRQAAALARGSTAYVTLEPCSHHGRTGPCADALISAGVSRVVVATLDANPVVRGNGVARLRSAGIVVAVGLRQQEAQRLNDAFARYILTGFPWVTLKAALSHDGYIAPAAAQRSKAEPVWLTGPEARAEVHRLRHAQDAILTGVGTVLADDPLLTDRSGLPRRRALLRVILDSQLRTPLNAKLLANVDEDVLILTGSEDSTRIDALQQRGALVETVESDDHGLSLPSVFAKLGRRKLISVMVEGGTRLNTSVLAGDLVDQLILFRAPVELGADAVPFVSDTRLVPAMMPAQQSTFGRDVCSTMQLHNYWNDK